MPDDLTKTVDTALKSLANDKELSLRIKGDCMHPLLEDGALVEIHKQKLYWPGDILVKRGANGQLFAHRLIGFFPRKGKLYFVSCADNATLADKAVPGAQIVGRITGGECATEVVSVPARDRIKAIKTFLMLTAEYLGARFSRIKPTDPG